MCKPIDMMHFQEAAVFLHASNIFCSAGVGGRQEQGDKIHVRFCNNNSVQGQILQAVDQVGFVSAVSIMHDFVPAIYDTTVIIPEDSPKPTMLRILHGQSSVNPSDSSLKILICLTRMRMFQDGAKIYL